MTGKHIKQHEIDRALLLLTEEVRSLRGFLVMYSDEPMSDISQRLGQASRKLNRFEEDLRKLFVDCLNRCVDSGVEIPKTRLKWVETDEGYNVPDHTHNRSQVQPCEVCGEVRAIELCHIVPREIGGGILPRNILYLCSTHHSSFDKGILTKEEWDKIDWRGRHSTAISYAQEVMLARQIMHWEGKRVPHNMAFHSFSPLTDWIRDKTGLNTVDEWNRKRKTKKVQRSNLFFEEIPREDL
jgi:hypothetical protein